MADKKINKEINQLGQEVHELITNQHISTFKTNPTNVSDLEGIQLKAYDSLKDITLANMDEIGKGAYSQVISRLANVRSGGGNGRASSTFKNDLDNLFKSFGEEGLAESLMSSSEQRNIIDYDAEIDSICEYMPILNEALDAKRDNVLSADQFNKDFLLIRNTVDPDATVDRINAMKGTHNLVEKCEEWFDQTSKYGETFVYIGPYNEEVKKLYKNKKKMTVAKATNENAVAIEEQYNECFNEAGTIYEHITVVNETGNNVNIDIEVNYSHILDSAIEEYMSLESAYEYMNKFGSKYQAVSEVAGKSKKSKTKKSSNSEPSPRISLNTIPGAIVKTLDRSRLIPLDVNKDFRFGYLYIEDKHYGEYNPMNTSRSLFRNNGIDMNLSNSSNGAGVGFGNIQRRNNSRADTLNSLTNSIASRITPKFLINNQDIKYELYNILDHAYGNANNDIGVKVSFIPAHNVEHIYWKKDANGRGISDLSKSLVPARLYIAMYTCNTIGILTRGYDRRAYYVKNNIDTNISQNMLSVINAIKANNKGMRDYSSIKNVVQTSGIFNDLLIPMNKNGESPIEFSIMEGQNIDTKEALMELLESMAISPIGVPYEYLMSRKSVDYAIRLTMANGKFLKDCYKLQGIFERFLSRIHTKIYNYEYNNEDILETKLPPPAYLSILNANQMIANSKEHVENVVDMINVDKENTDEIVLNRLKLNLLKTHLAGYIDFDKAEKEFELAQVLESPANGEGEEPIGEE